MLAITVRREEKEQRVLLGVHRLAHPVERAREVGHAADGEFLQRVAAAREGDGAPRGAEALVEQPLHVAHFAQEHVLAAVGREADEVQLRHAGAAAPQLGERALDQLPLQVKRALVGEACARFLVLRGARQPDVGLGKHEERDGDHGADRKRALVQLRAARAHDHRDGAHRGDQGPANEDPQHDLADPARGGDHQLEPRLARAQRHGERQQLFLRAIGERDEQRGAENQRDAGEIDGNRRRIEVAFETGKHRRDRDPRHEAEQRQQDEIEPRDAVIGRAHGQEQREPQPGEQVLRQRRKMKPHSVRAMAWTRAASTRVGISD